MVNVLQVANDSLLAKHSSQSAGLGTTIRYDLWEAVGATLENLSNFLESQYSQLVSVDATDNRRFYLVIPSTDFSKAIEILKDQYGLTMIPQTREERFWKVE